MNLQSVDQAMDLYKAADKYDLPDLVAECLQYVQDNLCPENTLKIIEFAKLLENKNLKVSFIHIFTFELTFNRLLLQGQVLFSPARADDGLLGFSGLGRCKRIYDEFYREGRCA